MNDRRPAIGIDARKLKDFGIGSYIRNLLEAVAKPVEGIRSGTAAGIEQVAVQD